MRIGIDWGGTKIELIALDENGAVLKRERISTPANYEASIRAVTGLIEACEFALDQNATVGIGIPGSISPKTGLVRNANSVWLNGQPLKRDMESALNREVRVQNDANCFAVSEAVDGAGAGKKTVVGVILGTGCGSGIAIDGEVLYGLHGVAGEFGHVPLPWIKEDEFPGAQCWCGQRNCLEAWISGTAFQQDYARRVGDSSLRSGSEILALDTPAAHASLTAYCDRLARALALMVNMTDPDVIVLGGGMSNVEALYSRVPDLMKAYVFSDFFEGSLMQAMHGDSSGVRGAAWLW